MPFPNTPSMTSSNTPTPSITASNTPTNTNTKTPCPSNTATPTTTNTPTMTKTPTSTPLTMCLVAGGAFFNTNKIYTSNNGISWSNSTSAASQMTGEIGCIGYGNGRFIAISDRPDDQLSAFYSDDAGITWSAGTIPALTGSTQSPFGKTIYVNNTFFFANRNVYKSTDGINWTISYLFTGSAASNAFDDVATDGNRIIAVGSSGFFLYSDDFGSNWTTLTGFTGNVWDTINWKDGLWLVGNSSGGMIKSSDGLIWTTVGFFPGVFTNINTIGINPSMWIVGGNNVGAPVQIAYSYDGISWSLSTSSPVLSAMAEIKDITYNTSYQRWVAVGRNLGTSGTTIMYSDDGINWISSITAPDNGQFVSVNNCLPYIPPPPPTSTPTITQTATQTQTPSQTITPTPSPTFCYEPQAYLVLDAASGSTALNSWMASQGSTFRGCNIGILPSNTLSVYEAQMNAYLNYSGWGVTTFYIEDEPIVSTTSLTHIPEQEWADTNVWNTWFVPTCPFCEGGSWTKWNGANLTSLQYNKVFYYSGTSIPQGYYRWLTTYTATNQRLNTDPVDHTLDTLVGCTTPTPTPTITQTRTPSMTPTQTATPSQTQTQTITPTINCLCFSSVTVNVSEAGNITFNDCNGNPTIQDFIAGDNQTYSDPDYCIQKDTNGGTAMYTIVSYNDCCSVPPPTITPTQTQTITPSPTSCLICEEYVNNTFETLEIDYQDCTGTQYYNELLEVGIIICVVQGTGGGLDWASMSPLGSTCGNYCPPPTPSLSSTEMITPTQTATPSPTITTETCAFLMVRTDASLNVPITGVEVNTVPVSYLSGSTFTITTSDPPGYFNTTQTGATQTVTVNYGSNISGQHIDLTDCSSVVHCCDLNPGGGTCTFTNVDLSCGCNWTIEAFDGTC